MGPRRNNYTRGGGEIQIAKKCCIQIETKNGEQKNYLN